ncbi:TetR/AcrR family transcriptional regulator [Streptomyces sp. CoH27]|uniref:TetR/AcrR family transcriptional regulator n=1 Tax=Streptomyces sp. CoH27 TaxID=2875763 RepID=UPI0027E14150|nr:TetR/AcrR family transcriptional regulator [Streptomyces sp. CoH27]
MSHIAKEPGIGRATLYTYFPDVQSILIAWHEHHIAAHRARLAQAREHADGPAEQREAVLCEYAHIAHERRDDGEIAALGHRDQHVVQVQRPLHGPVRDVITEAGHGGPCPRRRLPRRTGRLLPARPVRRRTAALRGSRRPSRRRHPLRPPTVTLRKTDPHH